MRVVRFARGRASSRSLSLSLIAVVLSALGVLGALAVGAAARARTHHRPVAPRTLRRELSAKPTQRVIVVLHDQLRQAHVGSRSAAARAAAVRTAEAPFVRQLHAVHATHIRTFQLVSAFSATVSRAERRRLASEPGVAKVIPDATIRLASPSAPSAAATGRAPRATTASPTPNTIPGACGPNGAVQLDPEGLASTQTASDVPGAPTARSLGFTGAGVKVAFIADGVDPNNINFIRPNGTSVFDPATGGDYQDFSGDGPNAPTTGGEAFLDANAIAGQGIHVYNVQNFSAQPDSSPCNIRIEGVAPGASLVGLKVFSNSNFTTTSAFLQAINYAVETDHVNVINESFGSNPFPDVSALDAIDQFDNAAVQAGVTVTASTGDAGPFNTIGSPSTNPNIISVGGSTDFRFYAQTNYALARDFATSGWLDNNISSLSSSGYAENGGPTVDLVAPGDLSFASCTPSAKYSDCTNFLGQPSNVEESGGTSQSSPFVAGAAALVIQAYEQTHQGAAPSPAVVKQILVSTATDLGAPAFEQGAGLLNSYQAVKLAEDYGNPNPPTDALTHSPTQLNAVGAPGSTQQWQFTLSNPGNTTQTVSLAGRTFGPDQNVQTGTAHLQDSSSPKVANYQGIPNNYQEFHFQVPSGADRLTAQLAWQVNPSYCNQDFCEVGLNSRVRLILIDPSGRFAAHSLPQGPGAYGETEVVHPQAGTWTGVIFGDVAAAGGTNGPVPWRVATQQYVPFGAVSPSQVTLGPGQSQAINVSATAPATPGDTSGSITITPSGGSTTTVPVTLRSLVEPQSGGRFSGTLTGGNGRPPGEGQEQFYEFDVPSGVQNIEADLKLANDSSDPVGEYLVSPDGNVVGFGQNSLAGHPSTGVSAFSLHPDPGRWTLVVDFAGAVKGNEISEPYSGSVRFNTVSARGPRVPDSLSRRLRRGHAVTAAVKITNRGVAPESIFVDPRLAQTASFTLAPLTPATNTLPLSTNEPEWLVPTETSAVQVAQTSTRPAMFDTGPVQGDPDLASAGPGPGPLCADTASVSYNPPGGTVTPGVWFAAPAECGPYSGPAPKATATNALAVQTLAFDPQVTSTTGDFWLLSVDPTAAFAPVTVAPGHTVRLKVTIKPSGPVGSVVSGNLYIDAVSDAVPPYDQLTASELAAVPYEYRVAPRRR